MLVLKIVCVNTWKLCSCAHACVIYYINKWSLINSCLNLSVWFETKIVAHSATFYLSFNHKVFACCNNIRIATFKANS